MNGQTDGVLTAVGEEQAMKLGKRLQKVIFDDIYCSDLKRAKDTLGKILFSQPQDTNLSVFYTKEFRENFIMMSEKGHLPREIFEYHGFDISVLGMSRYKCQ